MLQSTHVADVLHVAHEHTTPRGSVVAGSRAFVTGRLFTVAEVAAAMRVSNMTVYRLIRSGELPALRVGKGYRIFEARPRALPRGAVRARGGRLVPKTPDRARRRFDRRAGRRADGGIAAVRRPGRAGPPSRRCGRERRGPRASRPCRRPCASSGPRGGFKSQEGLDGRREPARRRARDRAARRCPRRSSGSRSGSRCRSSSRCRWTRRSSTTT